VTTLPRPWDQTVDVFRRPKQTGVAGLTVETMDERPLRSSRVRIDFYESRSSARGSSPVVRKPIALTTDTDVRVDDLWRLIDDRQRLYWYRVAGVTRSRGASRAVLEEIKR
jgi:hypothetical protein